MKPLWDISSRLGIARTLATQTNWEVRGGGVDSRLAESHTAFWEASFLQAWSTPVGFLPSLTSSVEKSLEGKRAITRKEPSNFVKFSYVND